MNKETFLNDLRAGLSSLPESEQNKALSFYAESIDDRVEDGLTEGEAVESLGKIEDIIKEILVEMPLASLIQNKIKESRAKTKHKTLWMALAICGFPVWLPLSIAFACVILAVYLTLWAVAASLFATVVAFAAAGVLGILAGIILWMKQDVVTGIAILGMGVAAVGLFLTTIKPLLWLCKKFAGLTTLFWKKVKTLFLSKKEEER